MNEDSFYWLDHIVLACPNLQAGMDYVEKITGCTPSYGGKHQQFGTHNALLKIGNLTYFEILAPDPDNPKDHKLWMGVELVEKPIITRFAIKSAAIKNQAKLLSNFSPNHGQVREGRREKKSGAILSWELTMPLPEPKIICIPFLIDWQDSIHPTAGMEDNCSIASFEIFSNDENLPSLLTNLEVPLVVNFGVEKITMSLNSPNGLVKF